MGKKKATENLLTLESFGSAKKYWTAWVSSPLCHFAFANLLSKIFSKNCSFIGNVPILYYEEKLNFPVYSLCFNEEFSVFLTIISNKTFLSHKTSSKLDNPLFGGLLFDDEYYIFNSGGLSKISSTFSDVDYILLLSADKNFDPDDYINLILNSNEYKLITTGEPNEIAINQNKNKSKIFLDYLQYLFYETESMTNDFSYKKLRKTLHNTMSVSMLNHINTKYPIEDERVITSIYLRREDF